MQHRLLLCFTSITRPWILIWNATIIRNCVVSIVYCVNIRSIIVPDTIYRDVMSIVSTRKCYWIAYASDNRLKFRMYLAVWALFSGLMVATHSRTSSIRAMILSTFFVFPAMSSR